MNSELTVSSWRLSFKMDAFRHSLNRPLITSLVFIVIITQVTLSGRIANGFNLTTSTLTATNNNSLSPQAQQLPQLSSSSVFQQAQFTLNQNQYANATRSTLIELRALFLSKSIKFDELFRQLLLSSKREFNHMFVTTYGLHYEKNSKIFTDMYEDLERYYNSGDINLDKSMDHFFQLLYRKLFQVFNSQFDFDEPYLNCISQQLEKLNPFGDYAINFISNIKRTFIATRTFLKALNVGIDIIKNMIDVS